MFIGADCFSVPHKLCLSFIFLCQLTWILPCIFFLLVPRPLPRMLVIQGQNATRCIQAQGFAGPLQILEDADLSAMESIYEEWRTFWPSLRDTLVARGFGQPAERTCFIWLPGCYKLAKHERIAHIVKEAIGPDVLLYGMTIWDGKNEMLQRFHRDAEVADCKKSLNFISGTSVELISQSHRISERLFQAVLKVLSSIEQESFKFHSKLEQIALLEKLFTFRVKRMVRIPDIHLEILDGKDGGGVFFHGGTMFRVGDVIGNGKCLLLQFISASCKIRDPRHHAWGFQGTSYSLYMPPVLLVAGAAKKFHPLNDVRLALAKEEAAKLKFGDSEAIGSLLEKERVSRSNEVLKVTVFREPNKSVTWLETGIWRIRKVVEASTTVMASGKIEQFHLRKQLSTMKFHNVAGDGEQVIVILREGMLYSRSLNEGEQYYSELMELRPGSAVLLATTLLHAFQPLGQETAFMSFRWAGFDDKKLVNKPQFNDDLKQLGFGNENPLEKELLGHGYTQATEGRTISLSSGQAYDPDNNENCDVTVFVIEGVLLQILPSNATLQSLDVLLIPADQSCVLWNVGSKPVKFFAMHLCHFTDAMQITTSFGASGKIF